MFDRALNMPLDYLGCFFKRDTWEQLIYDIMVKVSTPNLKFSPYSEVIHGSTTFKLAKG